MTLSRLCALISIAIGAMVLVGWTLNIGVFKSVFPGLVAMKANAALGFVLGGAALALIRGEGRPNRPTIALALAIAVIGLATLFEYAFGVDLGIDQILARDAPGGTGTLILGRMHPMTAFDFSLLGVAIVLIATDRGYRTVHVLTLLAMLVAGSALIGYAYGVRQFTGLAMYNQMAVHTAVGMIVLSVGVLLARPSRGLVATIMSDSPGGVMARRLLPVAILLPFTLDGLVLLSSWAQLFDARFATAVRVTATIAIFVGVILRLAHSLVRVDGDRRQSDRAFQLLADAMPQLAWMARPDGHIFWYNRRWYDYTGTTPEQMDGWGWQSVHDPKELERVVDRWKGCIASGEPFEMVFPLRGADGRFRSFLTRIEPFRDDRGQILHWFGTNTDIEEQKRAEQGLQHDRDLLERRVQERTTELALANAGLNQEIEDRRRAETDLRRGEEQFRTLADSIPQLAWMARPDGHIFWYNQRWYDYTGTTLEEMDGCGWKSVHDPDELPRVLETIQASFASGEPWECTFPIRRSDGVFRWHLSRMLPVRDADGRVTLWFGSNTDITEQKQLETVLRKAKEDAEAASRAKGEFLANMSHEIRTPMNGIFGMTELALSTDLTPRQREYLGLVKSSADALLTVIDDILDFSKIEAGKLKLDPVAFDLRDAITDTLRALALRAHNKGLELACRIAPELPEMMIGDSGRLRQVLTNLVGNAVKFTESGEVCVTIENAEGEEKGAGRAILISVADTGIGIATEKQATIFAPFEQADGSTTRKYGGTGLGLTISSRLVGLMGGRIWVDDNPGGGSIFRFTIRMDDFADARPPLGQTPDSPAEVAGKKVLVVDDNRTNRLILEELLAQWGCRVGSVSGGPDALESLSAAASTGDPFEVVLLDLMMPEMDGCTLADLIRRDPVLQGVRMLMLTSGGIDESARFRELGINGWLAKPVRYSELYNLLLGLLAPPGRRSVKAPEVADPVPLRSRLRVLLADDHPINQKVAGRMLESQGHDVTIVGDGRMALEAAESGDFDLILMDLQMPEMDGFEATSKIRLAEKDSGRHIPIVALTAHAMAGDREICLNAGFDDYLAKPVNAASLRAALSRIDSVELAQYS